MTSVAATLVLGISTLQPVPSLDNGIDLALGRAGLTRAEAQFDTTLMDFYRQGDFASPFYKAAMEDVWRTPSHLSVLRNEIAFASNEAFKVVSVLSRLTGNGSRRDLLGNPVGPSVATMNTPGQLTLVLGQMREQGLISEQIPPLTNVPAEVQAAAALVLEVALQAEPYRRAAFASVDDLEALLRREIQPPTDPVGYRTLLFGYQKVDPAFLFAAGQDITAAVQSAASALSTTPNTAAYSWRLTTAWGDIILNGAGDHQYVDPKALLIIDTGGNDTYVNCPAQKGASHWLSVVIDTDGDDKYLSESANPDTPVNQNPARSSQRGLPGPGSAFLGVTVLYDTKGNDLYRSARSSFGSATFGVAVHVDLEGDDTYDTYADSLGYGKFGIGLLIDREGNDTYQGFTQTMGVGMVGGVGMLLDQSGNDKYLAETQVIDFPSPQDPTQNVTMGMGAGNGSRMDYVNGRSLAGGVGILMDVRGNDEYRGGVFAQGIGYWMGLGVLYDLDGYDTYHAVWYAQGAAAHFAVGALIDNNGNDTYTVTTNMSHGAGHDFSFGFLWDDQGDDIYRAGNLALGAGNANGIGFFVDMEGTDTYDPSGNIVLGRSAPVQEGSFRTRAFSLGLFLDGYGNDTYPSNRPWARNGHGDVDLTRTPAAKRESQLGIFLDR